MPARIGLLDGAPDSPGYARLLAQGGRAALFVSFGKQVIPLCERAIDMAKQVGDLEVQAEAKNNLAVYSDDRNESLRTLEEVIMLAESNSLMQAAARANHNLSAVMDQYHIDKNISQKYYWRSVEFAKQIGDIEGMMYSLGNIYQGYIDLGEINNVEATILSS